MSRDIHGSDEEYQHQFIMGKANLTFASCKKLHKSAASTFVSCHIKIDFHKMTFNDQLKRKMYPNALVFFKGLELWDRANGSLQGMNVNNPYTPIFEDMI